MADNAIKVLLVDDEAIERQVLATLIGKSGLPISVVGDAENGVQAVELFQSSPADIVFLDIKMPGLSGLAVARKLKQVSPSVKIVMVTAYQEFDYVQEALRLGASDFLLKPYLYRDIFPILQKAVLEIDHERMETQKEQKLMEQLDGAFPYILMSFVNDLLAGGFTSDDYNDICARANFLGICSLPSQVLLADINGFAEITAKQTEVYKQYLKHSVFSTIKTITDASHALLCPQNDDHFLVLLDAPSNSNSDESHELAERIRSAVEADTEATVTIGIGRRYDPLSLRVSYREACEAQQLGSFFLGPNTVVSFEQLDNMKMQIDDEYAGKMETTLLEAVRYGDKELAINIGRQLLSEFIGNTDTPVLDIVKIRMVELLVLISRHATDATKYSQLSEINLSYIRKLAYLNNINSVIEWLESVIIGYINSNPCSCSDKPSYPVRTAMQYIKDHFGHRLTLEEISKIVFLNPYYFSRVFRQETGCTFIEYLTNTRIEHAKTLLLSAKITINAISRSVGYDDPNYFARLFNKRIGCTPREYRRLNGIHT